MITKNRFAEIDLEVKTCLNQVFDFMKVNFEMNYVLLLAEGEYWGHYSKMGCNLNPFVIDSRMDRYKDETRLTYLTEFLTQHYSFENGSQEVEDILYRMHNELMVYAHIWESKPFLKKLFRISSIVAGKEYDWHVDVPDMSKHEFIRDVIRPKFEKELPCMVEIMKKGFHTSLRNAFAHSEYSFDTMNNHKRIWLDTYTGKSWDIQEISFDEWSERFVYSSLFCYHTLSINYKRRRTLIEDLGKNEFEIDHPNSRGAKDKVKIKYDKEHDNISFLN
jgi:hypothetical protein